jgi:hypothetical protein
VTDNEFYQMAVIFKSSDADEVEVPTRIDVHDAYVVPDVI